MRKGANLLYFLFTAAALAFIILWQLYFKAGTSFYLVCVIVIVLSLLPFFISYEKSKPSAREISLVAVLSALAVASRAVFYFVPQFKPIAAVVIASAVCLGPQRGYIIGSLSAFVSNFIFSQGVWTPFQMVALGLVGFVAGIVFKHVKPNRWLLAVISWHCSRNRGRRRDMQTSKPARRVGRARCNSLCCSRAAPPHRRRRV